MRDIDDDSEMEEDMRANEEQHSRKRVHADHMMDAQELMRERQQYQSIQETTKKVSLLLFFNFFVVAHRCPQGQDP